MSEEKLLGETSSVSELTIEEELPAEIEVPLNDDVSTVSEVIRTINGGHTPQLTQRGNKLIYLGGDPNLGPLSAEECTAHALRSILAKPPFKCYRVVNNLSVPALLRIDVAGTVLAHRSWEVPIYQPERNRWLLRCPNGTVDLRNGALRDSLVTDMHVRQATVEYDSAAGTECPRFLSLLEQVAPKECCREALLQSLAYCLTGATQQQRFFWLYGPPGIGKSVIVKVLMRLLGSYATVADKDLLLGDSNAHPTNVAKLDGTRLVFQDEYKRGQRLRTDVIDQMTSQNTVSARSMREDMRDIRVSWKLFFSSNHLPAKLADSGDGIYRRLMLWNVRGSYDGLRIDAYENSVISAEGPQILNLLISRLRSVREVGISYCADIRREVDYREESSDGLRGFFADVVIRVEPEAGTGAISFVCNDDLRYAYRLYTGESLPERSTRLGNAMHDHGFEATRAGMRWTNDTGATKIKRGYSGVKLAEAFTPEHLWRPKGH